MELLDSELQLERDIQLDNKIENHINEAVTLRSIGWTATGWWLIRQKAKLLAIFLLVLVIVLIWKMIAIYNQARCGTSKSVMIALAGMTIFIVTFYFKCVRKHISFSKVSGPRALFTGGKALELQLEPYKRLMKANVQIPISENIDLFRANDGAIKTQVRRHNSDAIATRRNINTNNQESTHPISYTNNDQQSTHPISYTNNNQESTYPRSDTSNDQQSTRPRSYINNDQQSTRQNSNTNNYQQSTRPRSYTNNDQDMFRQSVGQNNSTRQSVGQSYYSQQIVSPPQHILQVPQYVNAPAQYVYLQPSYPSLQPVVYPQHQSIAYPQHQSVAYL